VLAFEADAESPILAEDEGYAEDLSAMSHQAYGPIVGVPRILELLHSHGIEGTFFVPGVTAERWPETVQTIVRAGHEVALHGHSHRALPGMTEDEQRQDLASGLEALADIGVEPRGYRAPYWQLTRPRLDLLGRYGIRYDSSLMDDDRPYRRFTTLPSDAMYDLSPRFSPDGRRIVFTRYITDPGRSALFTVGVDGGGLKQLTPWGSGAGDADYSPDGKKLVFEAYPNKNCYGEIYTVDSDSQNLTDITDNRCQAGSHDPVRSPDGDKILFGDGHAFSGGFGLATMNPDDTDRHFILRNNPATDDEEWEHQPDWESVR
jgi:hypothetical protein